MFVMSMSMPKEVVLMNNLHFYGICMIDKFYVSCGCSIVDVNDRGDFSSIKGWF